MLALFFYLISVVVGLVTQIFIIKTYSKYSQKGLNRRLNVLRMEEYNMRYEEEAYETARREVTMDGLKEEMESKKLLADLLCLVNVAIILSTVFISILMFKLIDLQQYL